MNPYTHRYTYMEQNMYQERRKRFRAHLIFFLLGLLFGGMIGFGVGASYNTHKQTVEHKVLTTHRTIIDHKVGKPKVTCEYLDSVYLKDGMHYLYQCSDGTLRKITL